MPSACLRDIVSVTCTHDPPIGECKGLQARSLSRFAYSLDSLLAQSGSAGSSLHLAVPSASLGLTRVEAPKDLSLTHPRSGAYCLLLKNDYCTTQILHCLNIHASAIAEKTLLSAFDVWKRGFCKMEGSGKLGNT
jgi:hypothetical protein